MKCIGTGIDKDFSKYDVILINKNFCSDTFLYNNYIISYCVERCEMNKINLHYLNYLEMEKWRKENEYIEN